jgi:hypothetical protein
MQLQLLQHSALSLLRFNGGKQGTQDIEGNYKWNRQKFEGEQEYQTDTYKYIAKCIVLKTPVPEFQGEKGNWRVQ